MCAHTLPIPLLLYALNIFGLGEFSNGSINLLFTSINKIRYKLLQYKLPCSVPPLTSAINDKEPPFSQLQETPASRTKFQPANVLAKSSVWIFPTAMLFIRHPGPGGSWLWREGQALLYSHLQGTPDTSNCRVRLLHLHVFPEIRKRATCTLAKGLG